jgi:hypothetical protein
VADLTDTDVRGMRQFLLDTCDSVNRWLPPPHWEPAWQSEAARECANIERGPGGAWGEDTVRTVYAGGALYIDTGPAVHQSYGRRVDAGDDRLCAERVGKGCDGGRGSAVVAARATHPACAAGWPGSG